MELLEKLSDVKNRIQCILKREKDEYKKMTKAEKRVAIAQDVIAQIKCETYVPQSGVYVDIDTSEKSDDIGQDLDDIEQKSADLLITEGMVQCTVCAKGAMFMSHIRKDSDTCTLSDAMEGQDENVIENRLTDTFSEEQLDLIESAFESDGSFYADNHDEDSYDDDGDFSPGSLGNKAQKYGSRYNDDQKRLLAIMRNIIRNKGTFKP